MAKRETNQGEKVVMKLMEKYMVSGRTLYADNFFSSYNLAEMLMDRNVAFVGTVRKNISTSHLAKPKTCSE